MGVQKFVQGQEDRNEIKRRANQYDQALGALQSGQELPQGIAPSVGLKAKDTWNSFQDNELSSKANKEAYTFSHGVKESANQILTRFSEISKQQGYDAGMDFLNKIPQSNLQQSQALALAHENLKRNRDFNIKRFDDAKRVAQEEGGKINQGLTHASNLYTMGDTTRAMDALTSVIQESRLPYTVKKDGDRYDIFHTNEQGESIKVKDDLKFEDVALAVKQAVPQLALSIAEQRSRVSDANAKNILSGGQIMQDTQTGKNVRVIQTVPKDGNLGGPVISIYDDDTGQLVQQATDPKQLKGRYRQPRQVETRQYVTPEGRVFTGTPEQARGLKARPVEDVKVERDLAGGGKSPFSKSSLDATRGVWNDTLMTRKGYVRQKFFDPTSGTTSTRYVDRDGNPAPVDAFQENEQAMGLAAEYVRQGYDVNQALDLASQKVSVYNAAISNIRVKHPEYADTPARKIPDQVVKKELARLENPPQGPVDRSGWTPHSLSPSTQGPLRPGVSTPTAVPYGGLQRAR
jgi:hypothetical protein